MDIPFLMAEHHPLHPVTLEQFSCQAWKGGVLCTLRLNQPVMLCGDRSLKIQHSHRTATAHYHSRSDDCQSYNFFAPNIAPQAVTDFSISTSMKLFATNGMCYIYSQKEKQFVWQYYADEETVFFSLFSSHIDTFDDGKRIV